MSRLRQAWIRAVEVFIFFAEPQCVEQEYPGVWWFRRRRPVLAGPHTDFELPDIVEEEAVETDDPEEADVTDVVVGPYGDIGPATPTQHGTGN